MPAQSYPPESDPVATALVEALDARVEALEEGGGVIEETDPIAGPALATHEGLTTGAHNLTALLGAKAAAADLTAHVNDASDAHDASAISVASPLTEGNTQAELERLSLAVESGSGGSGVILPWATTTAYVQGQPVTNGGHTYTANDAHTSGATFAGDLAAHWTLLPLAAGDVGAAPTTRTVSAGSGLTGGGDLSANRSLGADFGTGAGKVTQGNDSRLSDARTPTAHKTSHATGGSDALTPGDIGAAAAARGLPGNVLTKTANFTAASGDFILADATAGAFTITLPASGTVIVVKTDASANAVAVAGTINGIVGGASIAAQDYGSIFVSTATDVWRTIPAAPSGSDGEDGTNGRTILNGTAVPTTEGVEGDFYLRTTTSVLYGPKTAGAWGSGTSLVGAAGQSGLPLALTGAVAATRYVGGTATTAPTTGTFAVGDFVITQDGKVYVCTVAGSPGTWVQVGAGASDTLAKTLTGTGVLQVGNTAPTTAATGVQIGTDAAANLYRISASNLKTDAGLFVAGSFRVNSGQYIALDSGFSTGFVIVDAGIATLTGALSARTGFRVQEGTNKKQGVATLVAGTVVVSNTATTASSRIFLTAQDNNTTGALRVSARTASTSFTITSSNAGDTGVVAYEIFEPGN